MTIAALQEAFRYLVSKEEKPYPLLVVIALEQVAFVALAVVLIQEYVPKDLGLGVAFAGYVATALGTAKLAAQAPAGWLADRIGYKATLTAGLILAAATIAPLLLFSQAAALLTVAAAYGVGRAVVAPTVFAIMADTYPVDRRGRIGALANFAFFLGFVTGGITGVVLAGLAPLQGAVVLSISFYVVGALVVMRWVSEPTTRRALKDSLRFWRASWRALLAPEIAMWGFILLVISIGLNLLTPTIGPYARDVLGLELHQFVPFLLPAGLLGLLSIVPAGYFADRLGRFLPLLAGLGVGCLGLVAASYTASPWVIMLVACPVMLAYTASAPAVNAIMMDLSRQGSRGLILGALIAVQGLGGTIGPSIGGNIYDTYGPTVPFRLAAALLVVSIVLTLYYARWRGAARPLEQEKAI